MRQVMIDADVASLIRAHSTSDGGDSDMDLLRALLVEQRSEWNMREKQLAHFEGMVRAAAIDQEPADSDVTASLIHSAKEYAKDLGVEIDVDVAIREQHGRYIEAATRAGAVMRSVGGNLAAAELYASALVTALSAHGPSEPRALSPKEMEAVRRGWDMGEINA